MSLLINTSKSTLHVGNYISVHVWMMMRVCVGVYVRGCVHGCM